MINAVLYSDQVIPANAKVDARLCQLMKHRGNRIGYIPSGPDPSFRFFSQKRSYYARYGLDLAIFYDLDYNHDRAELEDLLACDAVHLSGGNTGAFLTRLNRSGMGDVLRNWATNGGLLIGTSAGAILMTPTIAVDALFGSGHPQDVKDGTALDLVPFEFFPHAQAEPTYLRDLLAYSTCTSRPIIACSDGDGVIVSNDYVECIGDPLWLFNGSVDRLKQMPLGEISA
jgi:dipeptidase E